MNKIFIFFFILLAVISCSQKEEMKFEAFSPEAFAYDIGDSWEVNSTVNVKGFTNTEANKEFSVSIDFTVDLEGPDSLSVEGIFADTKEVTSAELMDIQLEAQFELDYNFPEGDYKIIFNINDSNSGEKTTAQAGFELKR